MADSPRTRLSPLTVSELNSAVLPCEGMNVAEDCSDAATLGRRNGGRADDCTRLESGRPEGSGVRIPPVPRQRFTDVHQRPLTCKLQRSDQEQRGGQQHGGRAGLVAQAARRRRERSVEGDGTRVRPAVDGRGGRRAGWGEQSPERVDYRNGYRSRPFDTRVGTVELAIPKLRRGSYFPDWLLDPRRALVAECYVRGVSTRRVDGLVKTLGIAW